LAVFLIGGAAGVLSGYLFVHAFESSKVYAQRGTGIAQLVYARRDGTNRCCEEDGCKREGATA
jgi:hypothetical protein